MDQNGAKRYSTALFEVAKERGKVEVILDQMEEIGTIFVQNPEFMQILHNPSLQPQDKKNMVDKVFKGRVSDEIIGLLYVLLDHDKMDEFMKVNLHYRDIVYRYKEIKVAYVTTAIPMDSGEIDALKNKLSDKYMCAIEVQNIIDPDVIGGVHLKIGDEITDGTVRDNFQKMKKILMNHNTR